MLESDQDTKGIVPTLRAYLPGGRRNRMNMYRNTHVLGEGRLNKQKAGESDSAGCGGAAQRKACLTRQG